ncbi:MAG: hypothetical protein OWQ51_01880 [Pyrobaculum arsenaticum]|uniref:Uncharacterized protein n=2 Tax=Pyrobaculum arsenaticum TaxID=121277 RepID=A4WIF3_PYRAR|nr:hypothetical protein [Pyrobaculum arsenaticum]ABP50170.1 conserved hypothetical protein [Pyrobaculum arsenaticum DSM 13514]MCY0889726.1 hypothetical protein [Pyrobaculum arsenaticum]NYR14905.1 hypothetical protein [Pyrobaculum arsenaticum]
MLYNIILSTLRRDVYTKPVAALLAVGWAASVALASLGTTFAAVVTAINMLSLISSLVAMVGSAIFAAGDREGLLEVYLSGGGRARYAAARLVANAVVSALLALAVSAPYVAVRQIAAPLVAALLASVPSSIVGTVLGLAYSNRAALAAVVVWAALALLYDVVVAFLSLILPLGDVAILAIQLANFLKLPSILATTAVDPYLLTLGPLGDFITAHWGLGLAQAAVASVYAAWLIALVLFYADTARRLDL